MSHNTDNPTYYIFKDLRASQNNNTKDGFQVVRFATMDQAISAFNSLPSTWTTALGIHVSDNCEIDLVQRREGEPVLSGDYQRIPTLYNNVDVRNAVQNLVSELNIQWQSDYRIFGDVPVLIPVVANRSDIRDRTINGKHLVPEQENALHTAIKEVCTPNNGWCRGSEIYRLAEQFGYNNPHVPKLTTIHARFKDEHGQIRSGDFSPYNYILLLERTKLMAHDRATVKSLSEFIEFYIAQKDPKLYADMFGSDDRLQPTGEGIFKRVKDRNAESLGREIEAGNLAPLVEPIVSIIETGLTSAQERSVARELLGRVLNIPEGNHNKLPVDLRLRAGTVLNELYSVSNNSQEQERSHKTRTER